jgi:hypothetical protein
MSRKVDLLSSSGEGRETPTLSGPLERPNLNHTVVQWLKLAFSEGPNTIVVSLPSLGNRHNDRHLFGERFLNIYAYIHVLFTTQELVLLDSAPLEYSSCKRSGRAEVT